MQVDHIPSGYKLTEVGIIPSDWDVKKLGDITDVIMGQSPDSKNYNTQEKGVPLIQGNADIINRKSIKRVFTTEITKTCEKGDIVMTVRAPVGAIGISSDYSCIGRGVCSFKLKSVNQNYFFHLMVFYEKKCEGLGQGSTFTAVNSIDIKNIEIPLPPIEEQKRIAQVLSDIDELIRSLDELIIKKRNIKQGTMQLLLTGKQRLPGYSGEWETVKFGEIADPLTEYSLVGGPFGSNLKVSDYTYQGVRIIQLQNIGDGIFYDDYAIYTSEKKADELRNCNIYPGDIILSKMGDPVARACFIPNAEPRYLMASDGIRLVVNSKRFDKFFVFHYINSVNFRKKAIESSTGTTRQRISLSDLKNLPFISPPLEEQKAIARILSDMDEEIEVLEQKRNKYQDIKKGMMQELLTGKTRLV